MKSEPLYLNKNNVIYRKNLFTNKNNVIFILFFTIILGTLTDALGWPAYISFLNDAILLITFIFGFSKIISKIKKLSFLLVLPVIVFFCISLLSSLVNYVSPLLVIWAFRNTFRGIIYFFLCITFLEISDLKKIFSILLMLQTISMFLALYQLFFLQHQQDFIGGIFGYGNGAGVNTFNILLMSFYSFSFIEKKEKLWKMILAFITSFVIAAIAEEKITFIYFIILIINFILLSNAKFRFKIVFLVCGITIVFIGLQILKDLYPEMYEVMTNIDKLIEYATKTYDEGYRLPRIGSFNIISNLFFTSDLNHLLGIGFGNAETSTLSIFVSDFYLKNGSYNYRWFTHQWIFIEEGFLGFISYLFIFIFIGIYLLYGLVNNKNNKNLILTSLTCLICYIISIWYNATLKIDMCYIAFFALSIGCLNNGKEISNVKIN